MDGNQFQLVMQVYKQAQEVPTLDRPEYVRSRCADDSQVLARVLAMLGVEPDNGLRTAAGIHQLAAHLPPAPIDESGAATASEEVQVLSGQYRIRRVIGEGGMGTVYEAEQISPRRLVALKAIRRGVASRQMLRRFRNEAQILGRLQHPGIAQIFEAGAADSDNPDQAYFAMEFVRGRPLTEHVRERGLSVRDRLMLMVRVCDAVQHAHLRAVVHRDLKPGNILVTDDGQPKILDFGVARTINAELEVTTLQTQDGQFVGTLPYMSPEQVTGQASQVDTRSDVYALGVLLFEVLAGRRPFDLSGKSLLEGARVIREELPPLLGSINPSLKGDVEVIVAKALEKDAARRYQSAADLAEDLRRSLDGRPIAARHDSMMYVLTRSVRRHRTVAVAVALVALLVVGVAILSSVQARERSRLAASERNAKERALSALADAQTARETADQTSLLLKNELMWSTIERGRLMARAGNPRTAEELIWPAYFGSGGVKQAFWALRELYARFPAMTTFQAGSAAHEAIAASPDSRTMALVSRDGTLRLLEVGTWREMAQAQAHPTGALDVQFSADGSLLATSGRDGLVRVWDSRSLSPIATLSEMNRNTRSVSFHPAGKWLVATGDDGVLRRWDTRTWTLDWSSQKFGGSLGAARYSHDGRLLAISLMNGEIRLLSEDGTTLWQAMAHPGGRCAFAFSPDNSTLATGGWDRMIRLWDCASGREKSVLAAPNGFVQHLHFVDEGRSLISTGWWTLDRWDLASGQRTGSLPLYGGRNCQVVADNERLVAIGYLDGSIRILDLSARGHLARLGPPGAHDGRTTVTLNSDASLAATGDMAGKLRLFSAAGNQLCEVSASQARIRTLQFSPDSRHLVTVSDDHVLRTWSLADRSAPKVTSEYPRYEDENPWAVCFSPDGKRLGMCAFAGKFEVRDFATWNLLTSFEVPGRPQSLAIRFSPDGNTLATTSREHFLRLWTAEGQLIRAVPVDATPWTCVFAPSGRTIACGTWAPSIALVDVEDTATPPRMLRGHTALVTSVEYMPGDPQTLVSSSADGAITVWDVATQRAQADLDAFDGWDVISMAIEPGGKRFVASSATGEVAVWDLAHHDRAIEGNRQVAQRKYGSPSPAEAPGQ